MGKILFTLELPEPEVRKTQAPPVKKHKDKKLYSRKVKHKKSSVPTGDFFALVAHFAVLQRQASFSAK